MADPEVPEWAEEVPDWAVEVEQPTADDLNAIFAQAQAEQDALRATPPREIGRAEALVRGANQGATMGFADELLGAVESRFPSLAQMPGDVLADLVYPETARRGGQAPTYEEARNAQRALEAETLAQRPGSYLAGQVAGGIATSRRLPAGFASNVAQGAVQGVGDTEGEGLGDMASGAVRGAAFAGGADLAGRGIGRYVLPAAMSRLRRLADDVAVAQGRRVLLAGADSLAGNKELDPEAVRQALADRAIRPMSTTRRAYERLMELAEFRGMNYADILARLERAGVQGPEAATIARQLMQEADDALSVSGANEAIPNLFRDNAEAIAQRPPPGFVMPETGVTGARSSRLGLTQADRLKRTLQDEARWDRLRLTGTDEAKQRVSSIVRQAVEDAVEEGGMRFPAGSEVADLAQEFVPTKQQLSRTIAAREAAERGAAAAAKRSKISLTDYASGAAMGDPGLALLAAAGNNLARNRGTSAVAAGAYGLANAAGDVVRNPRTTQEWMARLLAVPSRQEVLAEYLRSRNRQPSQTQE